MSGRARRTAVDRSRDAPRRRHVVVLDQRGVAEPHSVVDAAAATHRVLLQLTKPGQGLSRVAHSTARSLDRSNPALGRASRHREVGQKLSRVRSATRSARRGPRALSTTLPGATDITVTNADRDARQWKADGFEDDPRGVDAAHDTRFARHDVGDRRTGRRE